MANTGSIAAMKAEIDANIVPNNNAQLITGAKMNTTMKDMVDTLNSLKSDLVTISQNTLTIGGIATNIKTPEGYEYMGIAHPNDAAITPYRKVWYLATEAGTYTNKGGLVVGDREVSILKYDTSWTKEKTGLIPKSSLEYLIGIDETSNEVSTTYNYELMPISKIEKGTILSYKVNTSSNNWSRLILCYNGENTKRILDTTSPSDTNVWKTWVCVEDISMLGLYFTTGGASASISIKVAGLDQTLILVPSIKEKTDNLTLNVGINLFNRNDPDFKENYYVNDSGSLYANNSYNVSGYIPIIENKTYYCASDASRGFRYAVFYDASKTYISGLSNDTTSGIRQFTAPSNAAFVRVTEYKTYQDKSQVATISTQYKAFGYELGLLRMGESPLSIATKQYVDNMISPSDVLYGKKWVACGDSFTHGDFTNSETEDYIIEGGLYDGEYKVYPFLIGNRKSMNVVNEAINGSTMTYIVGESTSAFSNVRYQNIPSDADYITLKFGINDDANHHNVPLGTIDDTENTTFYGAYNKVLSHLIQNHPQAKIGIIVTNGSTLDIVNATIAVAKKWGIPYLNEATDEQCSFMFRSNRTEVEQSVRTLRNLHWYVNEDSNSHPNALAHEFESSVVEDWLRSL